VFVEGVMMGGGWYRFWSSDSWRSWWATRRSWHAYRAESRSLAARIGLALSSLQAAETDRHLAERNGRWAAALEPQALPIKLAKTEIGLGTVPGVRLLELRRREGADAWTYVDSGWVFFTDRRLVFSGAKEVSFRYTDIDTDRVMSSGWELGVSTRKKPHVLGGPVEQLQVYRQAVADGMAGTDPIERWKRRWIDAAHRRDRAESDQQNATAAMAALPRPRRPFSPAWAPALGLALVVAAIGGTPNTDRVVEAARPTTTSTLVETQVLGVTVTTAPATAHVVRVISGDTVLVRLTDGSNATITLAGVRLEAADPDARVSLARLLDDADVTLRAEPAAGAAAHYVYVGGTLINAELIEEGSAYAAPDDLTLGGVLRSAEAAAKQAAVGLWAPVTTTSSTSTATAPTTTTSSSTTTTQPLVTTTEASRCHPSYVGACVPIGVEDVDCAGGGGNGPYYVGRVTVVGPDVYGLDRDGDGIGCE
jgi:endonuclease YncB( thermonuclease family)